MDGGGDGRDVAGAHRAQVVDHELGKECILMTDYGYYKFSLAEKMRILSMGYASIFIVSMLFYKNFIVSFVLGFACIALLKPVSRYKAEKRREFLLVQFKDLLYSLSASIATGRQMSMALVEAKENLSLIYTPETPMMQELAYITKSILENRESEETLLLDLAKRSSRDDIKNFVDVYRACRISGGNMEKVISNAGEILVEKIEIEKEIEALTGQKKFEGRLIMAMPFIVVIFLNIFSPEYIQVLYTTVKGRIVMTVAWMGILAAYKITEKIMDIKV